MQVRLREVRDWTLDPRERSSSREFPREIEISRGTRIKESARPRRRQTPRVAKCAKLSRVSKAPPAARRNLRFLINEFARASARSCDKKARPRIKILPPRIARRGGADFARTFFPANFFLRRGTRVHRYLPRRAVPIVAGKFIRKMLAAAAAVALRRCGYIGVYRGEGEEEERPSDRRHIAKPSPINAGGGGRGLQNRERNR